MLLLKPKTRQVKYLKNVLNVAAILSTGPVNYKHILTNFISNAIHIIML